MLALILTCRISTLTALGDLHTAFLRAISQMPSRLQIFEVIDEWMFNLEKGLALPRNADADLPDAVHQRVSV
jgi:hypothetical protein